MKPVEHMSPKEIAEAILQLPPHHVPNLRRLAADYLRMWHEQQAPTEPRKESDEDELS